MASSESPSLFCSTLDAPAAGHARGFGQRAALLNQSFWGRGKHLSIGFLEGEASLHRRVANIAQTWISQTGADVTFEFWIDVPADAHGATIRIAFQPGKGSWSTIGKFALTIEPSQPTMNLGWMSLELEEQKAQAVVLHEFGHALGLIHEHLNPSQTISWNKANVIADLKRTQGWDDATIEANMFAQYSPTVMFATDVDPQSIMMYPIPKEWTTNGFTTGFNSALTDRDKTLISAAYGTRTAFGAR